MNWLRKIFGRNPKAVTVINFSNGGPVDARTAAQIEAFIRRRAAPPLTFPEIDPSMLPTKGQP